MGRTQPCVLAWGVSHPVDKRNYIRQDPGYERVRWRQVGGAGDRVLRSDWYNNQEGSLEEMITVMEFKKE